MAVFGFIVFVLLAIALSIACFIILWDTMGTYNIGAVSNGWSERLFGLIVLMITIGIWYAVYCSSPFELIVK